MHQHLPAAGPPILPFSYATAGRQGQVQGQGQGTELTELFLGRFGYHWRPSLAALSSWLLVLDHFRIGFLASFNELY